MPVSTTTLTTIKARCQRRVGDDTTKHWSAAEWLTVFGEVTYQLLNDLMYVEAVPLFDYLLDNINLTLTADTESVSYASQITTASKTFYKFWKATWDDYDVNMVSNKDHWMAIQGHRLCSQEVPYMTFSTNGTFLLRPKPQSGTLTNFYFWWVKPITTISALNSTKIDLSEPAVPLFVHLVCEEYWLTRNNNEKAQYERDRYNTEFPKIVSPYRQSKTKLIQPSNKG